MQQFQYILSKIDLNTYSNITPTLHPHQQKTNLIKRVFIEVQWKKLFP